MKTNVQVLIVILTILAPVYIMAQESANVSIEKPVIKVDSLVLKQNLDIPALSQSLKPYSTFPASRVLRGSRNRSIDQSEISSPYHYNMPIVKPAKTSKILIAKLDPNIPYRYNMPLKELNGGK